VKTKKDYWKGKQKLRQIGANQSRNFCKSWARKPSKGTCFYMYYSCSN